MEQRCGGASSVASVADGAHAPFVFAFSHRYDSFWFDSYLLSSNAYKIPLERSSAGTPQFSYPALSASSSVMLKTPISAMLVAAALASAQSSPPPSLPTCVQACLTQAAAAAGCTFAGRS